MATTTLTLREIIIKIAVPLIEQTSFIDFRESGKNTNRFCLSICEWGGCPLFSRRMSAFFRSGAKNRVVETVTEIVV